MRTLNRYWYSVGYIDGFKAGVTKHLGLVKLPKKRRKKRRLKSK